MTSSGVFQGLSVRAGWVFRTDKALSIGEVDLSPAIASVNAAAHLCAGHHAVEDAHTGQVSRPTRRPKTSIRSATSQSCARALALNEKSATRFLGGAR
jgi:hypothetical protein